MENLGELLEQLTLLSLMERAWQPHLQAEAKGEAEEELDFSFRYPAKAFPAQVAEPLGRKTATQGAYIAENMENIGPSADGKTPADTPWRNAPAVSAEELSRYFERDARRYG